VEISNDRIVHKTVLPGDKFDNLKNRDDITHTIPIHARTRAANASRPTPPDFGNEAASTRSRSIWFTGIRQRNGW
jgi:hypothetical protein